MMADFPSAALHSAVLELASLSGGLSPLGVATQQPPVPQLSISNRNRTPHSQWFQKGSGMGSQWTDPYPIL